eukprot:5082212-Alexandrium_andersonii.AAC.1
MSPNPRPMPGRCSMTTCTECRPNRVANRSDRTERRTRRLKQPKLLQAFEPGTVRAQKWPQHRYLKLWRSG